VELEWKIVNRGSMTSGHWSIQLSKSKFTLRSGWHHICELTTIAGCKRIAQFIDDEISKDVDSNEEIEE